MSRLRLYPGAVTRTSLRGLIVTDLGGAPAVSVGPAPGAAVVVKELPETELSAHLRPLSLWSLVLTNLPSGAPLSVLASIGTEQVQVTFRTLDPAATRLEVVVASCFYDGFHYAANYAAALKTPPLSNAAFKLLIGDNLYLDIHGRTSDPALFDGFAESAYVYRRYFVESDAYADVLSTLPTCTTWDDHEFWNNYPEEQIWLSRSKPPLREGYKRAGLQGLSMFQAPLNPAGIGRSRSYVIDDSPVASFFIADGRSDRGLAADRGPMLHPDALAGLTDWAAGLTGNRPGVLVLGQPLMLEPGDYFDYTPASFRAEYDAIWEAIHACPWEILVVSGDVHHSRALALSLPTGRKAYEIVTSPASHIPSVGPFGGQGQDDVKYPAPVKPSLGSVYVWRYPFGTNARNSLAHLSFTRVSDTAVDVGCTFLDLASQRVPSSVKANVSLFYSGTKPDIATCTQNPLLTLRKRGSTP